MSYYSESCLADKKTFHCHFLVKGEGILLKAAESSPAAAVSAGLGLGSALT